MTSITARYPGHCPGCSERIEIGDTITLASDDGAWVCRDCVNEGMWTDFDARVLGLAVALGRVVAVERAVEPLAFRHAGSRNVAFLRERLADPEIRGAYVSGLSRRGKVLRMADVGILWTEVPEEMRPKIPWGPHLKRHRRSRR